ncbi:MAG: histidine phosphatase family protein [Caldilineaceae bacterium]|nr:histidine phosphatase family protein [Caldilineaceae bacterium]MCB0121547.1 histidine phosphatase family protein [Caldilineaceae bacterium]HRW04806.1 histidine phosphatase family protein [Caldilineaceae bacterium]
MHLYLIRHGQSYANLPEWDGYNRDESLTELGLQQAAALEAWLPDHIQQPDALYASTMQRARQTAEHVARAYTCEIIFDDRLRELGNNRFDHTTWPTDEPPNRYADYWATARPFAPIVTPGEYSETFMHFRTRVGLFVEEMIDKHSNQHVVAVCHGGVIDAVFDHVFNVGPWRRCEIWTHNTGITYFEHVDHPGREVWRLHAHDRTDHLVGLAGR